MYSGLKVQVTCSCGETCVVNFNQKKNEYEADNPKWKWDDDRFWHCGQDGHRRASSREVRPDALVIGSAKAKAQAEPALTP